MKITQKHIEKHDFTKTQNLTHAQNTKIHNLQKHTNFHKETSVDKTLQFAHEFSRPKPKNHDSKIDPEKSSKIIKNHAKIKLNFR